MQWLKLKLKDTRPTFICNTYRPPNGNVDNALELLTEILDDIHGNVTSDLLIMGDINIDLTKRNASVNKYKSFLHGNVLTQLVQKPTIITNTMRSLLDHIITNNTDYYHVCDLVDPGLSDHSLVFTSRKRLKIKHTVSYFIRRSYRNFHEANFYSDVKSINWLPLYTCDNINNATEYFTKTLLDVINIHAPFKRIKCRSEQPKWINSDSLSLINEKEHRFNIYK